MFRRRRPADPLAHVDPQRVDSRWRDAVVEALDHRRRFGELAAMLGDGPTAVRVAELGGHVDAGVSAVWDVVQQGMRAQRALAAMDPTAATDDLKAARRALAAAEADGADTSTLAARVEALNDRHVSVQRTWNAVDDVDARVRLIDARLGAVVALCAELVAGVTALDALDTATRALDDAIDALAATREALAEIDRL